MLIDTNDIVASASSDAVDLHAHWEPLMTRAEAREAIGIWQDKHNTVTGIFMLACLDRPAMAEFFREFLDQPDPLNMVEVARDFAGFTATMNELAATIEQRSWLAACDAAGFDPNEVPAARPEAQPC